MAVEQYPAYKLFTLDNGQTVLRVTICRTEEERNRLIEEGYSAADSLWLSNLGGLLD